MKFKFRLEKMLHFARMEETMKLMEVAEAQKKVEFWERRKQALEEGVRLLLSAGFDPYFAVFRAQKAQVDTNEVARIEKLLVEEKALLEKRKQELTEVLQKKKALEALKEKRYAEHRVVENRREQAASEEAFRVTKRSAG